MPELLAKLDNVTVRYRRNTVLDKISADFSSGEVVGVIGRGGGGKTQLLRVLSTLRTPSDGTVTLFGQRVNWWQRRKLVELRTRIGLQFQNFALFDFLDVFHNVAFPLEQQKILPESEIETRVRHSLERVGLPETETKSPSELSGGMRRRVAIARVMAAQPDLAIFDDPVAGLDPINSAKIMRLLRDFAIDGKRVVFIATHDIERLFPVATRVLFLHKGRLEYDGPVTQNTEEITGPFGDFVRAALDSPDSHR